MWPRDAAARAHARSISAEMHAGFGDLRQNMPMNIHAHASGQERDAGRACRISRASRRSGRDCLAAYGGPFLFGEFGIADAMFAPVVMRFNTCAPALIGRRRAYVQRVTALPAVQAWIEDALSETHAIPYRTLPMNIYAVGGAIRDELLGVPVQDRDYVVVGATPEQMVAQGYRPVGKDFPVFLHPQTHEEYALARTERKTAAGYHGFQFFYAPDVTLEEDLARRDLTINAMAREVRPDGELTGPVIDPFNGRG